MIPTEPIGSIPRSDELVAAMRAAGEGSIDQADLDRLFDEAVQDTILRMEVTGSPVVTDGEQRKPSFATYPVHGLASLGADGSSRAPVSRRTPAHLTARRAAWGSSTAGSRS